MRFLGPVRAPAGMHDLRNQAFNSVRLAHHSHIIPQLIGPQRKSPAVIYTNITLSFSLTDQTTL